MSEGDGGGGGCAAEESAAQGGDHHGGGGGEGHFECDREVQLDMKYENLCLLSNLAKLQAKLSVRLKSFFLMRTVLTASSHCFACA